MASKIRIKLGPIEVEYEGSEEFLREDLTDLISAVTKLHRDLDLPLSETPKNDLQGSQTTPLGTTAAIASRLNCRTGGDLVWAAATKLVFVDRKESLPRKEILDEMKTATGFYKTSMAKNLSQYLRRLVKQGQLNEISKDTYSIPDDEKTKLRSSLS